MRGTRDLGDKVTVGSVGGGSEKSYPLAKVPNNFSYETVSDQPEVEPNQPLAVPLSFHGGVAYSKYNVREASVIDDAGMMLAEPNIIGAGLAATGVTLTNAANPPQYFFEATVNDSGGDDGQPVLYVIAPEGAEINVYKVSLDSGDFGTLLRTKTFAVTPTQPMCRPAEFNDGSNTYWWLGLGDPSNRIQSLTSIVSATAADTWAPSGDADARHFQGVNNRLARSTGANEISLLPRGSDPAVEANWGDEFFVGDVGTKITELGEAAGLLYMGKEGGFYEWDTIGEAENVLPEIGRAERNCQGMVYWHGGFLIPAESGLWWTRTGKPVGPDSNPYNRGNEPFLGAARYFKHGRWMGLAPLGTYIYGLYVSSNGSNALLVQGREREPDTDPPGWGPIIWHIINIP
ncbi:hypothetical protein LCGC14_2411420, partial [marine sediment metagenome]